MLYSFCNSFVYFLIFEKPQSTNDTYFCDFLSTSSKLSNTEDLAFKWFTSPRLSTPLHVSPRLSASLHYPVSPAILVPGRIGSGRLSGDFGLRSAVDYGGASSAIASLPRMSSEWPQMTAAEPRHSRRVTFDFSLAGRRPTYLSLLPWIWCLSMFLVVLYTRPPLPPIPLWTYLILCYIPWPLTIFDHFILYCNNTRLVYPSRLVPPALLTYFYCLYNSVDMISLLRTRGHCLTAWDGLRDVP